MKKKLLITRGPETWNWFELDNMAVKGAAAKANEFKAILDHYGVEVDQEQIDFIGGMKPGEEFIVENATIPSGAEDVSKVVVQAVTGATPSGDGTGHSLANATNNTAQLTDVPITAPLPANGILSASDPAIAPPKDTE